jgi:hypothetical protein
VVHYPGGAYHTSCAVHSLTKDAPVAMRGAALRALRDLAAAPPEAALAPLAAVIERTLRGGDPGLQVALIDAIARPYGTNGGGERPALTLPDITGQ